MADVAVNPTVIQKDRRIWDAKHRLNAAELIAHAARKSGRSAFSVGLEALRWRRSRARLQLDEYVKFRLYDPDAHSAEERECFITWMLHNACITKVNDERWFAVTEDKWLSARLLADDGLPVPEVVAMIDTSPRRFHGIDKVDSPQALRRRLADPDIGFPLFGKHNSGLMSVGVFTILSADADGLELRDLGVMSYETFFEKVLGRDCFILQRFVENHPDLARLTATTATVRMVNMLTDEGLWSPAAVLKLPSSRNQADNFWRDGNLLCHLDPQTGEILRIVGQEGPDLVEHERHPETGAEIVGRRLPHWDRLLEVNEKAAWLHAPLRYQSADIAITEEGPVIIEMNAGSSFTLPQFASGKGFMTPKVRHWFRKWGADFIWP